MLIPKSVRDWFEAYAVDMGGELNGGGWDISGDQLDLACEAIAQAAEEETAKLQGQLLERRTICEAAQKEAKANFIEMRLAQDEVAKLRPQVAVMTEALELHDELRDATYDSGYYAGCEYGDADMPSVRLREAIDKRNAITKRIKAALSAAPKVVWSGEAVMGWDGTMPELLLGGDIHTIPLVAGDVHDVLVLAHEQGQDSKKERRK